MNRTTPGSRGSPVMRPDFVFGGMAPYIRGVSDGGDGSLGGKHVTMALSMSPVVRVGQALAQATLAAPRDREAILLAALPWRETLALALAGVDAAIADVRSELGIRVGGAVCPPDGEIPMDEGPAKHVPRKRGSLVHIGSD